MVMPEDTATASDILKSLDGTSRKEVWTPLKVRLVTEDDRGRHLKESDFPWLTGKAPVLKQTAVGAVGSLFELDGEFLPLSCDTARLLLFNVLKVVDALDIGRSDLTMFPNTNRIMAVRRYAFTGDHLDGEGIFRVPQLIKSAVFVTERIVNAVEQSNLKGVGFRLLWQSAP